MRNEDLIACIVDLMKKELKNYHYPQIDGKFDVCNVYRYNVPSTQDTKSYPFLIVRLIECEVEEDFNNGFCDVVSSVAIGLGIFSQDGPEIAGKLLDNLCDTVLYILRRTRTIDDRFNRRMPLNLTVPEPDKQWHDFHMATIISQWDFIVPAIPLYGIDKGYKNLEAKW